MKIKFVLALLLVCVFLTGCGNKECAKWVTRSHEKVNCTGGYYECLYKNLGNDGTTTQECVEWK